MRTNSMSATRMFKTGAIMSALWLGANLMLVGVAHGSLRGALERMQLQRHALTGSLLQVPPSLMPPSGMPGGS
jgi:hypothetical protein